jgi:hypothetical protein
MQHQEQKQAIPYFRGFIPLVFSSSRLAALSAQREQLEKENQDKATALE